MPILKRRMREQTVNSLRSCLVQYSGGGYEGCFWEWNYAFFDPNGKFHNLLSTGRAGCPELEDLQVYLNSPRTVGYNPPYLYKMDRPEDVLDFVENTNAGGVVMVAKWLHNHWPELDIIGPCSRCKHPFPLWSAVHDGYRGAGGLSIVMCGLVCCDCEEKMLDDGDADCIYQPTLPTEHVHVINVDGEASHAEA